VAVAPVKWRQAARGGRPFRRAEPDRVAPNSTASPPRSGSVELAQFGRVRAARAGLGPRPAGWTAHRRILGNVL